MRRHLLLFLAAPLTLAACDDGSPTADPPPDVAPSDAGSEAGPEPDRGPDLDRGPDTGPADAAADTLPADMAGDVSVDMTPREPVAGRLLALDAAEVTGSHAIIEGPEGAGVLLDPGATLRWTVDPGDQAEAPALELAVAATIWRVEDGAFRLRWTAGSASVDAAVEVRGDADAPPRRARLPYAEWTEPAFGPGHAPPPVELPTGSGPWTVELEAVGGGAVVREVWLLDPLGPLPDPVAAPWSDPPEAVTVLQPTPCAEPDCDDGALITAAIDAAPEGPVRVQLAAGTYTLRSTLRVARDHVSIEGVGADGQDPSTTLFWDPPAGGQIPAVRFAGAGLRNGEAAAILSPFDGSSRFVRVDAGPDWRPERVWITADDFGDVPPVCIEGRDVERFDRHIGRFSRVLSISPDPEDEEAVIVELDRPLHIDAPPESNPRLVPAGLIRGGGLFKAHLEANCPEALAIDDFSQAPCSNPTVLDDDGLFIEWAEGTRAGFVSARAFGKFHVVVQRALDVRIEDCSMDHPAAYGDGGQGYGVHLIRTGRTVVRRERVAVARHGVVVDFGSSDAQVLDADLRTMSQALIDVHGEASYDTLVRGNVMAGSNLGIIVGGGGRDVHCNDGPRHHLEGNVITDAIGAGITISDYTRGVFVRGNTVDASGILVTTAFGAGDVLVEHNLFGQNTLGFPPVQSLFADTSDVRVRRNRFTHHCSEAAAGGAVLGAEAPLMSENQYCPGE